MTLALLIAGIVAVAAGFLSVVYGITIKEFSLGSTLILGGTIGVCSGMLLIGMHAVVQELRGIARRLGTAAPSEVRVRPVLPAGLSSPTMTASEAASAEAMQFEPASPASRPPWQDEAAARERQRVEAPVAPEAPAPSAEPPRRRNLLFQSTSRKERERAQAKASDPTLPLEPPATEAAAPSPEVPPASFDDAWPKPERMRPSEAPLPRRSPRTPFAEAAPPPEPPPAPPEPVPAPAAEQPPVTVLKSGVVDGMAYSLYSDGSIEAQMPEGMMRFASIDELRSHLDQRP
jgi:hypothetical protein